MTKTTIGDFRYWSEWPFPCIEIDLKILKIYQVRTSESDGSRDWEKLSIGLADLVTILNKSKAYTTRAYLAIVEVAERGEYDDSYYEDE